MKRVSGKFVLRLPPDLHVLLQKRSKALNVSLNTLCSTILASAFTSPSMPYLCDFSRIPASFLEGIPKSWKDMICGIILFGSHVRGEGLKHSDIDLLIVLKDEVELTRELYSEWDRNFLKYKDISPQFVKLPKDPLGAGGLWYEVALEGIVLWQSDNRILQFLWHLRQVIASRKVIRSFSYGHPYWIKID